MRKKEKKIDWKDLKTSSCKSSIANKDGTVQQMCDVSGTNSFQKSIDEDQKVKTFKSSGKLGYWLLSSICQFKVDEYFLITVPLKQQFSFSQKNEPCIVK